MFHASCLLSGLVATAVGLMQCRSSTDQHSDLSRGRAVAGLVSFLIPIFRIPDSSVVKWLIFFNLTSGLLFPFREQQESLSRPVSLTNIHKNLMVI